MATELALSEPVVASVRREIDVVHDDLTSERRRLAREVSGLLDGGWSGRAAQEHGEAWTLWEVGCEEVLGALDALAAAMTGVADDLLLGDGREGDALAHIRGRLDVGA